MDVHEYQAKELLASFGVPIPKGAVAFSPDQAVYAATELGGWHWAVKAQIHAGARGKAGGIRLCKTYNEVRDAAKDLLGRRLVTHQNGPEGKPVQRVYIETADPFERELYLGFVLDRKAERVRVIASQRGGMDIEEIAATEPEALLQVVVEPAVGLQQFEARELAFQLGLDIKQVGGAVKTIMSAYRAFRDCDATMLEINPLVVTKDDRVLALDAKMSFDDNALFRRRAIADMHDRRRATPRGPGRRAQPQLHRPRRRDRLHRQRRRPRHGDDGHDQALPAASRRIFWTSAAAPRPSASPPRSGWSCPTRT